MANRLRILILTVTVVATLIVFFIWAPVVPFERLETISAPGSPVLCPGTQLCEVRSFDVWVKSYASLSYDAFGLGTAPFTGPVSMEKNGVTVIMLFNGTNGISPTDTVAFPVSNPEPLPLLRINGLTVYPHGAPFGGTVTQISVTNLGVGETAEVSWSIGFPGSAGISAGNKEVPAGATVLLNSTDWTGAQLPPANTNVTITVEGSIHYAKLWLYAFDTQSIEVTYAP